MECHLNFAAGSGEDARTWRRHQTGFTFVLLDGNRRAGHARGRWILPRLRAQPPERILQLGTSFWACQTLLSAVELELFTELAAGFRDVRVEHLIGPDSMAIGIK
jgi:hypothetical protein